MIAPETPKRTTLGESASVEFKIEIVAADLELSGSIEKESIELKEENLHYIVVN